MFKFRGYLLEITSGNFEGSDWAKAKIRSVSVSDNKILTYKVNVKKTGDIAKYLDKECDFVIDIARGEADTATMKVVSVSEAN